MPELLIEVCVEGIDGLVAAQEAGADRIELCASLMEGGITPGPGTVREALRRARVPFHAMVRPRGGDFLYTDAEFATMLADIDAFRDAGVPGVVFGCLNADATVDETRTAELVARARPMRTTFHRAFDMTRDASEALEALIRCGIGRVLTSGQRPDAVAAIPVLRRLHEQAAGRIVVLGCGALTPETVARVRRETGLAELHFSALAQTPSPMTFRNTGIGMGSAALEREYTRTVTDPALVARMIRLAREAGDG